jgi:hypothetical protein
MTYEQLKALPPGDFKRACGVYPQTCEHMLPVLRDHEQRKVKPGRPATLSRADQLLMALQYWREYRTSCYVNLQGKKKTLPLSDSSHRLLNYLLCLYSCLRRLSHRLGASRLHDLLVEVAAVATRSSGVSVRAQETICAAHFQPCWQCYRHQEGHEVAVGTLFRPVREDLAPSRALAPSSSSSSSSCSRQCMRVRSCAAGG